MLEGLRGEVSIAELCRKEGINQNLWLQKCRSTRSPGSREGDRLKERTIEAIRRALEAAGVEFTNGEQPGVRLTKAAATQLQKR